MPNKVTGDLRQAFLDAFTELGGTAFLTQFGREHPGRFVAAFALAQLAQRGVPVTVRGNGNGNGSVT